jgi:hypothetical protein
MRSLLVALLIALMLALGVLEVVASRRAPATYPDWHPDAFAIWHAR